MPQGLVQLSTSIMEMTLQYLGYGRTDDVSIDAWRYTYSKLRATNSELIARVPKEALLFWSFVRIDRELWGCDYLRLSHAFENRFDLFQSTIDKVDLMERIGDCLMFLPQSKIIYDESLDYVLNHTAGMTSLNSSPYDVYAGLQFSCVGGYV
jgi:hypothetical protein